MIFKKQREIDRVWHQKQFILTHHLKEEISELTEKLNKKSQSEVLEMIDKNIYVTDKAILKAMYSS